MSDTLEYLLSALILLGAIFTLIGSIGLAKLPDFYMRLHGPTKASTLGAGALLTASVLYFSLNQDAISLHEILITLFLFITAPIGALLMAKAALHIHTKKLKRTGDYRPTAKKSDPL